MATKIKKRPLKSIKRTVKPVTRTIKPAKKAIKRHVKQSLIPRKANKYQPHLVRSYGLVMLVGVVLLVQAVYNLTTSGSVLGQTTDISAKVVLDSTNNQRLTHREKPLEMNTMLSNAAYDKATDMFQHQYWAHVSPSGVQPWAWFDTVGYKYQSAGENLAKGFHSSGAVVTAWMESEEHRANILDSSYRDVGIAVVSGKLQGKDTTLVVALYGTPVTKATTAVAHTKQPTLTAAPLEQISMADRVGVSLQSLTPALLTSIILLMMGAIVALMAQVYRKKLPKPLRQSWYRHHGLYKAVAMSSLVVIFLALYGGGQI